MTHIDPVAKNDSVHAEVTLDNADGIVPGISAELDIETYLNDSCLTIPIEASKTDRTPGKGLHHHRQVVADLHRGSGGAQRRGHRHHQSPCQY